MVDPIFIIFLYAILVFILFCFLIIKFIGEEVENRVRKVLDEYWPLEEDNDNNLPVDWY